MNQVTPIPKTGNGGKKQKAAWWESLHMDAVAQQCCVITGRSDNIVLHHPYHDRIEVYGGKRAPHTHVIPVWQGIHQGLLGHKEIRLHGEKQQWREIHGADHSYVPIVWNIVYGDAFIQDEGIEKYWSERR